MFPVTRAKQRARSVRTLYRLRRVRTRVQRAVSCLQCSTRVINNTTSTATKPIQRSYQVRTRTNERTGKRRRWGLVWSSCSRDDARRDRSVLGSAELQAERGSGCFVCLRHNVRQVVGEDEAASGRQLRPCVEQIIYLHRYRGEGAGLWSIARPLSRRRTELRWRRQQGQGEGVSSANRSEGVGAAWGREMSAIGRAGYGSEIRSCDQSIDRWSGEEEEEARIWGGFGDASAMSDEGGGAGRLAGRAGLHRIC